MGIGLIVAVFGLLTNIAHATGLPWYVGQTVAEVEIVATQGSIEASDLRPILRTQPGMILDSGHMRSDVALLVQAGGFAAVEVFVQAMDDASDEAGQVRVVYKVVLAPRLRGIHIRGARGAAKRGVTEAVGIDLGDPWFGSEDASALIERVTQRLNAAGWTQAVVNVDTEEDGEDLGLYVRVTLNDPAVIKSLRIGGVVPLAERRIRKWLRNTGLSVGKRVDQDGQEEARRRVLNELRKRGWDRARVNLFSRERTGNNEVAISVLITPGPRLVIDASGRKLPNKRILRDTLGIRAGDRITENLRQDAERRLKHWYAERGFADAQVRVDASLDSEEISRLKVEATPGPRRWVQRYRWPDDTPISEREMMGTIVEAAPDTLGDRILGRGGLDRASAALEERFTADGYLDAEVNLEAQAGRPGWVGFPFRFGVPVEVTVNVDMGPQIDLASLSIRGGVGHEADLVAAWVARHEGKPLNAEAAAALESAITQVYESLGYLSVSTALKTVRDRASDTAVVDINILEGEQVRLRSIVIRGNRRTQRHVVEREILLAVGEPIAPEAIAQTRTNLYNLDLFRLVSPELIGEEVGSQDLLIRLEERPNILLEAGGGVSTDEGVRTTGRATHRNIAGLGHRLTTLGTIGYGWFGDEWTLDTASPVWRAATRYELPYIPGRGGRLVFEGLIHETIQEPTWRLSRSGGAIGLKMRLSKRAEAVVDYRVQVRRLVDVDPGSLVNGDPWLPFLGLSEDISGEPILESGDRVVSGGSFLLVFDGRDDRFNPKSGGLWSTHLEVGDGAFSGDVTMRATAKVERLFSLGPLVLDLVGRGGIGMAQGQRSTLPLEERFFLGGGTTLRGFSTNSVGPANFARRPNVGHPRQTDAIVDGLALADNSGQWAATGGDAMAAATVELRMPMPVLGFRRMDGVDLVVFSDMGHVGFVDSTVVTTSRLEGSDPWLRSSVGAGLRFSTPVGPASIDIGINTRPIKARNEAVILPHFTLGVL
jgi:outer membrane protein insertion porin family